MGRIRCIGIIDLLPSQVTVAVATIAITIVMVIIAISGWPSSSSIPQPQTSDAR